MTIDCPIHKQPMLRRVTQYGPMYICTEDGCDMMKWGDSELTTPADANTRASRHVAHGIFDKLWQDKHMLRKKAYTELSDWLDKHPRDTHIGLFTVDECNATVKYAEYKQKQILLEKFK